MREHRAAVLLAKSYIVEIKKYTYAFPTENTVQESKWWKFFLKAAKHKNMEGWEADLWIDCQFEKYGRVYPPQLSGKNAVEAFEEYSNLISNSEKNRISQIVTGISSGIKDSNRWFKKNNDGIVDYVKFFDDKRIKQRIKRREISHYFISICRSFQNDLGVLDLIRKRKEIYRIKNLPSKLHGIMGKEFIRKFESIL